MIIDVHCHYTLSRRAAQALPRFRFEPIPASTPKSAADDTVVPGTLPTAFDSCVSPRAMHRLTWRLARWALRLPAPGPALDAELEHRYATHLLADGPVDRHVILAFDAVHNDAGGCQPLAIARRDLGSDMYTSNSFVRALCRQHPKRFLFGASVHPYRPDALSCIEEVFAAGACLLKWIPLHHNIDATDPRTVAALRRCGELGLPLLAHYGEEFSLTTHRPAYRNVAPLLATLHRLRRDGTMPTIILAHAATPVTRLGDRAPHELVLDALANEFADAPLYADISALTAWTKVSFLRSLLARRDLHAKLLFGSDFPVPTGLFPVRRLVGSDYRRLARLTSWPQRAAAAYRRMGFEEIVLQRAAELLPHTAST